MLYVDNQNIFHKARLCEEHGFALTNILRICISEINKEHE